MTQKFEKISQFFDTTIVNVKKYGRFLKHFVAFSEYLNLKFPNGPVNNFQEVFNDPQVLHNEMVQTVTDETFGEIKQVIHNNTVGSNAF